MNIERSICYCSHKCGKSWKALKLLDARYRIESGTGDNIKRQSEPTPP